MGNRRMSKQKGMIEEGWENEGGKTRVETYKDGKTRVGNYKDGKS